MSAFRNNELFKAEGLTLDSSTNHVAAGTTNATTGRTGPIDISRISNGLLIVTTADAPDLDSALAVRMALDAMDGQDRRLLIGRYWQDLPSTDLAVLLGVAEPTIRVRLHRLKLRLRKTLVEA